MDAAVRLGVAMVLVVPCTDWFITFTQLGGGDTHRATLFAPVRLVVQMVMLPAYIWLFFGGDLVLEVARGPMLWSFLGLIVTPFGLAALTQRWWVQEAARARLLAALPVPLLAGVIFLIAASQVDLLRGQMSWMLFARTSLVFVAFLVVAGLLGRLMSRTVGLGIRDGRALTFSFGTRNSFVVLPLALALPQGFELATVVIVLQSLVELFGMAGYVWWVPTVLLPDSIHSIGPGQVDRGNR